MLCAPIGSEYTRSHRSLRHLADRFARAGIPAVRFDYHGTGNSPGWSMPIHDNGMRSGRWETTRGTFSITHQRGRR